MKTITAQIRTEKISSDDIKSLSVLLADAFAGYELHTAARPYLKDEKKYRDFLVQMHKVFLNTEKKNIIRKVNLNGELAGLFILHQPHTPPNSLVSYIKAGGLSLRKYIKLKDLSRFAVFWDSTDTAIPEKEEDNWHLLYMAVSPKMQGHGIAAALLDEFIPEYIRRHGGSSITLTTNNEKNLGLYQRHGYKIIDTKTISYYDQKVLNWTMIRNI